MKPKMDNVKNQVLRAIEFAQKRATDTETLISIDAIFDDLYGDIREIFQNPDTIYFD